jgi:hypothetical protein
MAARKKKPARRAVSPADPRSPRENLAFSLFEHPLYRHGSAVLFLILLSVAFFSAIHFSGKSLIASDTVSWRAMAQSMLAFEEETGEEALWATNAFAGMPGYAIAAPSGVPQIDSVPAGLRRLVWPTSHFVVLLLGTYVLGVLLTGHTVVSLVMAGAYGFTTYIPIILAAGHNSKFIALAFAPWLLAAFAFTLKRPGWWGGLLFAIALAANLRAGHIQITSSAAWVLALWWLSEGVAAFRGGSGKAFVSATGWLVLGGVMGILMVAHPYLAVAEYKAFTIRGAEPGGGAGGLAWEYAMGWSQGVGELLTLLIADSYGGAAAYWGPKGPTGGPHYVGGVVLALAVLACARYRTPAVSGLGLAALFMTLFSLGEHFPALNRLMFAYFPLFDAFRVPETWLSMVALVLAVLAGIGLKGWLGEAWASGSIWRNPVMASFGSLLALTVVLTIGRDSFLSFERPGEPEMVAQQLAVRNGISPDDPRVVQAVQQYTTEIGQERRDLFTRDAWRTLLFLALGGIVLLAASRAGWPAWLGAGAVFILVLIDLWGVDRRYFNEDLLVDAGSSADRVATYDFDRYLLSRVESAGGPGHFRVLSLEGNPTVAARPSFHYESLGGYSGAKLRLYQDALEQLLLDPATGLPRPNALDLLSVRFVASGRPVPGLEAVYTGDETGFTVYEKRDVLPRAYFVEDTEVIPDAASTWERLRDPALDLRRQALVAESLDLAPAPIDSMSTATVLLRAFTPHEIAWQVDTDRPRLLVVSEVYYPAGWSATIDGAEVPIHRVNYLVRGIVVPAGAHDVQMRFAPRSVRIGYQISLGATLLTYGGMLVLLVVGMSRRKKGEPSDAAVES